MSALEFRQKKSFNVLSNSRTVTEDVKRYHLDIGIGLTLGVKGWFSLPGRSLSTGCQQNLPVGKEVIAGWILVGNHSVKDNKWLLGYVRTII